MKVKKLVLSTCLMICLGITMIAGATAAYFTDTDEEENVFTFGNVQIVQLEQQRTKEGELEDFKQNQIILPIVTKGFESNPDDSICSDEIMNGTAVHFIDTSKLVNVYDKIVRVENTSVIDIWAATLIAYEDTDDVSKHFRFVNGDTAQNWTALKYNGKPLQIKNAAGEIFTVNYLTYDNILGTEGDSKYSSAALTQFYMHFTATQEDVKVLSEVGNGKYDIHCVSLGIQSEGFLTADEAMEEGFNLTENISDANIAAQIASMFGDDYVAGYYANGTFNTI